PFAVNETTLGGLPTRPEPLGAGTLSWRSSTQEGLPAICSVPVRLGAALTTSLRASGLGEPPPDTFRFQVPGASANDAAKVPSGPAVARASTRLPAGGIRTVTVRPSPSVAEKFGAAGV